MRGLLTGGGEETAIRCRKRVYLTSSRAGDVGLVVQGCGLHVVAPGNCARNAANAHQLTEPPQRRPNTLLPSQPKILEADSRPLQEPKAAEFSRHRKRKNLHMASGAEGRRCNLHWKLLTPLQNACRQVGAVVIGFFQLLNGAIGWAVLRADPYRLMPVPQALTRQRSCVHAVADAVLNRRARCCLHEVFHVHGRHHGGRRGVAAAKACNSVSAPCCKGSNRTVLEKPKQVVL